jgi:hypothetical protein
MDPYLLFALNISLSTFLIILCFQNLFFGFAGLVGLASLWNFWGGDMFPAEKDPVGGMSFPSLLPFRSKRS